MLVLAHKLLLACYSSTLAGSNAVELPGLADGVQLALQSRTQCLAGICDYQCHTCVVPRLTMRSEQFAELIGHCESTNDLLLSS